MDQDTSHPNDRRTGPTGLGPHGTEPPRDERSPTLSPRRFDEQGRLVPISEAERSARTEALRRTFEAMSEGLDTDPPDTLERMMRGIDEHRPAGSKLFEGYY